MKQNEGGAGAARAASSRAYISGRLCLGDVGPPIPVPSFLPLEHGALEFGEAEAWRKGSEQNDRCCMCHTCWGPRQAFSPGVPRKLLLLAFDAACSTTLSGLRGPMEVMCQAP